MRWHNYTQHSGCGHYGEVYNERYTLCQPTYQTLMSKRGPSSPPIAPPQDFTFFPQPAKRSNTTKSGRFFGLRRSSTAASTSSRRAASGPGSVGLNRASTTSGASNQFPDYEMLPQVQACPELKTRTIVTQSVDKSQVCSECSKWIEHMRNMIAGYDKRRGLRGSAAFKEFLEDRRECRAVAEELGFGESRRTLGGGMRRDSGDELYGMQPLS
ncbi:hypothetical protein PMIN02_005821 [Paraphaeosphaeria minitans]|uniref:Uncharacterized protein n=1 Tax=Paraphaeosphaeria minitans TaxID=565426 RepID=A0A9P6KUZ7_9PLEO|nr:hypothetical protein PMIN01_02160 [Paraphaeosphaeria minitans]